MNIYDIAKKANVSIATISRVLNNSDNVSEKTRKKVMDIIEELDYKPNEIARGLATNSTKTIGIMVPDIRNPFHSESAFVLEQRLNLNGYSSILCNTTEDVDKKVSYLKLLYSKKVDGIITVGASFGEEKFIDELREINKFIPVIMINNLVEGIISIYCDEEEGIDESIYHLKKKGYRFPMYVVDKKVFLTRACINKLSGFKKAMKKYYPNEQIIIKEYEENERSYFKLLEFIKENGKIDAIQFEKDTSAIRFMKVAISEGVSIPKQLGIVGFDNIDITDFTQKKISTIDHKINEHCNKAVNLLLSHIDGKKVDIINKIEPKFIPKETT